jgi:flagellar biosynthesis GTPase FlhF
MQGMNDMMQGYVGNMSNDLKKDFKNMLATYDQLIEKDKSKADSLNMQKAQIQSLIDKLNSNKRLTASELYKLRKENETLRGIMRSYVRQIDSLNTLNIKLTSDLDQTSTKLNETTSERDQFRKESEEKGEKIKQGSRLQAYGFTSEALRMKLNKTTEQTDKAKNVIQFRSSFTISENSLTNAGRKSVYMQIIGPDGQTFQSSASNKIETDNGTIAYSDKKEIDYANQAVDLTIYYDLKSETASKGNYKVKIYCDGNLIGSDNFTLK